MIVKKLKFLLKPPIPSLFLSGLGFVALEIASRVSVWGLIAWFFYALYIYTTQVNGRGKMGISFFLFSLISLWVIRGVMSGVFVYASALCIVILFVLFLGAIGYRFSKHEATLQLFYYLVIGMSVAWWASGVFRGMSLLATVLVWGGIYFLIRDRNRFLIQMWSSEDSLLYILFTILAVQYAWGVALLPLGELDIAALFLVFFVIGDDAISVGKTKGITREYIYRNLGLYVGCSVAILALSFWF